MKVYVFGNEDLQEDSAAIKTAEKFTGQKDLEFVFVKPNEDLPFVNEEKVVIMDVVAGVDKVQVIGDNELNKLVLPPRNSVHDFDLGFQLKYLKKLGKLGEVKIIGLPMGKKLTEKDYRLIHSIFKKLVAQDMQGS